MSSKRKNTPTKLSADELLIERERLETGSDGDSPNDSESEYESSLAINNSRKHSLLDESREESSSPELDLERPQSKKQRILQSIRGSSDSETEPDSIATHNHNNNLLTKPSSGLMTSLTGRKSMDSVLRRLQPKVCDTSSYLQRTMNGSPASPSKHEQLRNGCSEPDVMSSIKAAISGAQSAEDKEKKLSDMIAQLSALKESIAQQKEAQVSTLMIRSQNWVAVGKMLGHPDSSPVLIALYNTYRGLWSCLKWYRYRTWSSFLQVMACRLFKL